MRSKRMRFQRRMSRHWQAFTRAMIIAQIDGGLNADDEECERCGGDGFTTLHDSPDVWGEDCCAEEDRLITCPACRGQGNVREILS